MKRLLLISVFVCGMHMYAMETPNDETVPPLHEKLAEIIALIQESHNNTNERITALEQRVTNIETAQSEAVSALGIFKNNQQKLEDGLKAVEKNDATLQSNLVTLQSSLGTLTAFSGGTGGRRQ